MARATTRQARARQIQAALSPAEPTVVEYTPAPTQRAFIKAPTFLNLICGPRGEGKSTAGLFAVVWHAIQTGEEHWPLNWALIRDTRRNIGITTGRTIQEWFPPQYCHVRGKPDEPEVMTLSIGNVPAITFDCFGVDSAQDLSRFQSYEASGGVWIEEPAPAATNAETLSSGIAEVVLGMAITSCRGSKAPRVQISMNPPPADHWTAQLWRFPGFDEAGDFEADMAEDQRQARAELRAMSSVFFIPPGENTALDTKTPGYREKNRMALLAMGRRDLFARMVEGRVGYARIGEAVTSEFGSQHLAPGLTPIAHRPLFIAYDFGLCFDDQTDVLTRKGWKRFADVSEEDQVATLNPDTRYIEYQTPTRHIAYPYEGPMHLWAHNNLNLCVTPDHRIPYTTESYTHAEKILWTTAAEAATWQHQHNGALLTAQWEGKESRTSVPLELASLGWDTATYVDFMALWLSEGTVDKDNTRGAARIGIAQNDDPAWLRAILAQTRLPWKTQTRVPGRRCTVHQVTHQALATYLRQFGKQPSRCIPREICELPSQYLWRFIDVYTRGDGHARQRANGSQEHTLFTSSAQMAGDLQELALKVGWFSSVRYRPPSSRWFEDPTGRSSHEIRGTGGWDVTMKKGTKGVRTPRALLGSYKHQVIDYKGMVYCVTVPNGIIYVRRQGRPSWSGNCPAAVLAQITPQGLLAIHASFTLENTGMTQLIERLIRPWLNLHPDITHIIHIGGVEGRQREQSNSEENAVRTLIHLLGGRYIAGPVSWSARRDACHDALIKPGVANLPWIRINPQGAASLVRALDGGWHYPVDPGGRVSRDLPEKKGTMPSLGDAFAHLVAVLLRRSPQKLSDAPFADTEKRHPRQSAPHVQRYGFRRGTGA